jgi:4-hydroxy-2-oxoheptanedioate aldolase
MMKNTTLKEKLDTGRSSLGTFMKFTDPAAVEIIALAGFDHAVIDMEHGPVSVERAQDLVRAAYLRGLSPLIRVNRNEPGEILRALDIGAEGIHIPHISSAADAEKAVKACFYHPLGDRGVCRYVRAADYSASDCRDHFEKANRTIVPILHVEGCEGLEALPDILDIKGTGVLFLGPYDLSQSCGRPGEVRHPEIREIMRQAVSLACSKGVAVGTFADNAQDVSYWHEAGVRYICCSVDIGIFLQGCRELREKCDITPRDYTE